MSAIDLAEPNRRNYINAAVRLHVATHKYAFTNDEVCSIKDVIAELTPWEIDHLDDIISDDMREQDGTDQWPPCDPWTAVGLKLQERLHVISSEEQDLLAEYDEWVDTVEKSRRFEMDEDAERQQHIVDDNDRSYGPRSLSTDDYGAIYNEDIMTDQEKNERTRQ